MLSHNKKILGLFTETEETHELLGVHYYKCPDCNIIADIYEEITTKGKQIRLKCPKCNAEEIVKDEVYKTKKNEIND